MLTADEIKAIRDRCEAATPGPWNFEDERYSAKCVIGIKPRDDRWIAHAQPEMNGEGNGNFIAHARTDLPRCLDEIERLRQEVTEWENEGERVRADYAALREALDTYAQFSDSGEVALVSGRLARDVLSQPNPGAPLLEELALLRAAATTAHAFFEMRGRRGQLGSPKEVIAKRDAAIQAIDAWRAKFPAAGKGAGQ